MTRQTRAKGKRGREAEGGRIRRKRRRFISRTTRKCSNRTVPRRVSAPAADVRTYVRLRARERERESSVRAWHACVRGWRRLQGQSRLWPRRRVLLCATGAPWTRRTRRFGRSGSTLKHGIYCGNSFCSTLPVEDRVSAEPPLALPISLSGWHIRRTLLDEST